jgi:hypothetical protein
MTAQELAAVAAAARVLASSRPDLARPLQELVRRERAARQERLHDDTAAIAAAVRRLSDSDVHTLWLTAQRAGLSALSARVAGWAEDIQRGRDPGDTR